jgi:L-asparaginase
MSSEDFLNAMRDVLVLTTGGTIDKTYDEFDGTLENRESQILNRILKRLRMPYTHLHVYSLMSKDSLHMNNFDRSLVLKSVQLHMEKGYPIVLLHGTDSMAKTAEYIEKNLSPSVPIVFTGAMKPMGFDDSDATQNVTEALLAAQLVGPGVYISFHNRLFQVPGVRKNKKLSTFEAFLS